MNVAFVLHSHLPWVRRNGTFPCGEEWLFQSWAESYLPLLEVLEGLAADGHRNVLTLGVTPVLAQQLDDPYLVAEFHGWLGRRLLDLQFTMSRYGGHDGSRLRDVWSYHWRRQSDLLERFERRYRARGLLAPFVELADAGVLELLGGPATHPYLPLVDDAALLRGQLAEGLRVAESLFGRRPTGVWTPECAYRPAGPVADPTRPPLDVLADGTPVLAPSDVDLPGLEEFWAEAGADHLVLDAPTLARAVGAPDRVWADIGGEAVPPGDVLDVLDRPVLVGDSPVAAFARNLAVSYAVWSPRGGYPGDPAYRDFYRVDMEGGFKSWRVTSHGCWDKEPYEPRSAARRAIAHAEHFVALLHRHLDGRPRESVVVAAYDTELFGHWWHEGPLWLGEVLRRLARDRSLSPTTLAASLEQHPPTRRLALPESSWGRGKGHRAWVTPRSRWIWEAVRDAEARFRGLPPGRPRDVAWRQLCLLQASDWPFLVVKDQAAAYAEERVRGHLERFDAACRGERLDEITAIDGAALAAPAFEAVG